MRDLTEQENNLLNEGRCPFCKNTKFFHVASGGMSENIECSNDVCTARFCFHGGMFTAQLIKEPIWPQIVEKAREKKRIADEEAGIICDGEGLLDFMSPPKDRTLWAKIKRRITDKIESSMVLKSFMNSVKGLKIRI